MTENIGYKLRRLREDNNMSVSDISSQSGVHPSQIESIEKGELIPSVATLVKLSRSLGVRLGTFLDGMESTGRYPKRKPGPPPHDQSGRGQGQ